MYRARSTRLPPSAILALSVGFAFFSACAADLCPGVDFPVDDEGALYVAAACGDDGNGDGTRDAPYATIGKAASVASTNQTIAVAAGTYTESVVLKGGVRLIGASRGSVQIRPPKPSKADLATLNYMDFKVGIEVTGGAPVEISHVTVFEATPVGIRSRQASLLLDDVAVRKTGRVNGDTFRPGTTSLQKVGGHGVQVSGGATLEIRRSEISDNQGTGVLASGAGGVQIIDPSYIVDPAFQPRPVDGDEVGIVDPAFQLANSMVINGNTGGGVAIIDPSYSPTGKADEVATPDLQINGALLQANTLFGVAVFGGSVRLNSTAILLTQIRLSTDVGYGLVVAPGQDDSVKVSAQVDAGSVIAKSDRIGLLVASSGQATSVTTVAGDVSRNSTGGVWLQGEGANLKIVNGARLSANSLIGVGVTGGARIEASGGRIDNTVPGLYGKTTGGASIMVADGIGVFEGSTGHIAGVQLDGMARSAVIVEQGGTQSGGDELDLVLKDAKISNCGYALVVNKGGAKASDSLKAAASEAKDVKKPVFTNADEPVRVSACGEGTGKDLADCTPKKPDQT